MTADQRIVVQREVGDRNPTTALEDELRDFGGDEVLVLTHPRPRKHGRRANGVRGSPALLHLTDHDGPKLSYDEEEVVVESIAVTMVGGLGIDTSGYSIPYLTSWSEDDRSMAIVEACAELIDQHAKRIEDAIGDPTETLER